MVWHPEKMDFAKIFPAGLHSTIPYHFYFHPTPNSGVSYPYGKDAKGDQLYVGVGYRHLMFESWANVQHYYAMKNVVFVVPVGSSEQKFGEVGSSLGIFTILREINLALHMVNNADPINFLAQDIGRVAISGFSAGVDFMINALSNQNSPLGQSFVENHVKEIYSWDGAVAPPQNTVPDNFAKLIQKWWRNEDQFFRIYTSNSAYSTKLAFMDKFSKQAQLGAAGSYVKSYVKDGIEFGSILVLPGGFFKNIYKRKIYKDHFVFLEDPLKVYKSEEFNSEDLGFPTYVVDTHHWFFKVFMYHALIKSKFPDVKTK